MPRTSLNPRLRRHLRSLLPSAHRESALKSAVVGAILSVVLIFAGCDADGISNQRSTVDAAGADIFPSRALTDWVSYAQQMSVVTVVDEARIEPPARVYETNEGYVGRTVTIRIDKTAWRAEETETFPDGTELTYTGWGWFYKNGEYTSSAAQLEVGERYLMPIVKGRETYHPLTTDTRLPLHGDRVDPDIESNNPAVMQVVGKTVAEVGAMLEQTPADPIALKYWHLDPVERVRAVIAETHAPEDIEEPIPGNSESPQSR